VRIDREPSRRAPWPAVALAACVAAACSSAAAQETGAMAPQAGDGGLAALSFLAGCWAEGPEGLREQFTAPTANLILGTSRYVRGGRVVEFEFHTIRVGEAGPVLTPHPGGRASVPFAADSLAPGFVVWSNPEHDFPQRIIYDGREDGVLRATIEGPRGGETARMGWRMSRVACEGS
jgi:hypothetical protein